MKEQLLEMFKQIIAFKIHDENDIAVEQGEITFDGSGNGSWSAIITSTSKVYRWEWFVEVKDSTPSLQVRLKTDKTNISRNIDIGDDVDANEFFNKVVKYIESL